MENDTPLSNSAAEVVMSDPSIPTAADPSPSAAITSLSESMQSKAQSADATPSDIKNLLADPSKDTSATSTAIQDMTVGSDPYIADTSAATPTSQSTPGIDQSHAPTFQTSIPQVSLLPATPKAMDNNNMSVSETSEEFIVMDSGTATRGSDDASGPGSMDPTSQANQPEQQTSGTKPVDNAALDQPKGTPGSSERYPGPPIVTPWQDILISMLSELGFVESSRMMAAEELVLSATQRENAPSIIQKFSGLLQESISGTGISPTGSASGPSKRQNIASIDIDSETIDSIKRRRVGDAHSMIQENASRAEIEDRMVQFMAAKREQINESNRQEFIKGRVSANGENVEPPTADDDGCARVDARKVNRTIQMKLETVKNEALTKTNPRTHAQVNDVNTASSGLDERLRNIQVHLNLRIAAVPACTIAERIRIVEDVIIQLERDYPLWSALHFNQPNRVFPPPPSVTTVSRNARNQIVITGDHLHTTLVENGDSVASPAALSQYPQVGMSRSVSAGQVGSAQRQGVADVNGQAGPVPGNTVVDGKGAALAGPGRPATASPVSAGGSATVIKLKRHGGAGSSSLARAVQQQLAQRKANAASGGHTIDESRNSFGANNNGSTPSFKITSTPYRDSPTDTPAKSGISSLHASSAGSSPGSSLSPTVDFTDPLKPGVTGRGPIKSRRKSLAKGLDPTSAMASMSAAHTGNILGTNPGTTLTSSFLGATAAASQSSQSSAISEGSLGSFNTPKAKSVTAKKPRKKKGEDNGEGLAAVMQGSRAGAGRGKGGFGLGKGKGGGRPLGLGLGKGKGGAYRLELLRRAEVEEFDDESDEDIEDEHDFQGSNANAVSLSGTPSSTGNGTLPPGNNTTFLNDNSALAHLVSSALKDQVNTVAQAQHHLQQQQQQQQQQAQQPSQVLKSKKQPRKQSTSTKPPPVRKFGGKSFGMAGGESSGSSSNESSDGEGTGSSGSQSDTSSSSGISGSDPGDSD
ncbi:hypothetical protein BGZ58_007996 [Dissophora ornata]|nr:hypothetical protein BGZ58_007996 [Dissophora ornata]